MRGASAAASAADYSLWLRYADTPFSTHRRFSGKGRFVEVPLMHLDYDRDNQPVPRARHSGAERRARRAETSG